ncbi:hypothetical protein Q8G41_27140, partial [Klebsiella pneumoniae]|uniref:hypothetical protein n=1 Tax=Klebsiella pneumoniae TaxID=573 RepID=UPI0030135667
LISLALVFTNMGPSHVLRAWLEGAMACFAFAGGGTALLMLQYVSGGKWGLLLRRPLEAMSRTLPVVFAFFVPLLFPALGKHLWQWVLYPTVAAER